MKVKKHKHQNQHKQKIAEIPLPKLMTNQPALFSSIQEPTTLPQQTIKSDTAMCINLLSSIHHGEMQIKPKIEELCQFTNQMQFGNGMKYFGFKDLLFNEYLICLKFYQLFRLNGTSLTEGKGLQLYEKLIYLKTLLMKLGPIEKKIQYQKDKLLKKGEKLKIKVHREQKQLDDESQQEKEQQIVQEEDSDEEALKFKPQTSRLMKIETHKEKKQREKFQEDKKYAPLKHMANLPASQKSKRRDERRQDRQTVRFIKKAMGDIEEGEDAQEQGMQSQMDRRFMKQYEEQVRREQWGMQREQVTKKQKSWIKKMKRDQLKGNQLEDELRQTEQIRNLINKETSEIRRPQVQEPKLKKKKKKI